MHGFNFLQVSVVPQPSVVDRKIRYFEVWKNIQNTCLQHILLRVSPLTCLRRQQLSFAEKV